MIHLCLEGREQKFTFRGKEESNLLFHTAGTFRDDIIREFKMRDPTKNLLNSRKKKKKKEFDSAFPWNKRKTRLRVEKSSETNALTIYNFYGKSGSGQQRRKNDIISTTCVKR